MLNFFLKTSLTFLQFYFRFLDSSPAMPTIFWYFSFSRSLSWAQYKARKHKWASWEEAQNVFVFTFLTHSRWEGRHFPWRTNYLRVKTGWEESWFSLPFLTSSPLRSLHLLLLCCLFLIAHTVFTACIAYSQGFSPCRPLNVVFLQEERSWTPGHLFDSAAELPVGCI